jgi:hypothetical protein
MLLVVCADDVGRIRNQPTDLLHARGVDLDKYVEQATNQQLKGGKALLPVDDSPKVEAASGGW